MKGRLSVGRYGSVPQERLISRHPAGCSIRRGEPRMGGRVPAAEGRHSGRRGPASSHHGVPEAGGGAGVQIHGPGEAHRQSGPAGCCPLLKLGPAFDKKPEGREGTCFIPQLPINTKSIAVTCGEAPTLSESD